jgi:hypothetical protein
MAMKAALCGRPLNGSIVAAICDATAGLDMPVVL